MSLPALYFFCRKLLWDGWYRGNGTERCIAWHRVSTLNGSVQTSSFWSSTPFSAKALSNISYSVSIICTVMAFNRVFKYFCEVNDQETVRTMTWLNQRTVFLCTLKSCLMRLSNEIILWALNNMRYLFTSYGNNINEKENTGKWL